MISPPCKYYIVRINPGGGLLLPVVCMGDERYAFKFLVREPEGKL